MDRRPHAPRVAAYALIAACVACAASPDPPPEETFAETFDRVWSTVDETYPYFEAKGIDWTAQRDAYRAQAASAASEAAFRDTIAAMLGELRDWHVALRSASGGYVPTYHPAVARNWSEPSWSAALGRRGIAAGTSSVVSGRIGTVGYVAIRTWVNDFVSAAEVDAALEPLRDASALIVDVRMNGGGNDGIAYDVAGRFTAQPTTGAWFQFRDGPGHGDFGPLYERVISPRGPWTYGGPVLLLVGAGCMSSCEGFVSAMRALGSVRLAGDTTRGSSGNPREFPLRGDWTFNVSQWIQYTHDMRIIEGQGIAPAVALPWTPEDLAAGEDPVLEGALALVAPP